MNLVLIKYNAGNVRSVLYALQRLKIEATVTDEAEQIRKADKVIFPGVGEASTAMNYLKERKLDVVIKDLVQPVLGICLGMQLLCKHSAENDTECLGIFDLAVKRFGSFPKGPPEAESGRSRFGVVERTRANTALKIPQIGWNNIYELSGPLFQGIKENSFVYFVHSYYVEKRDETIATAGYGLPYSAAIQKDNFYAVQFHPEKSAVVGQKIIENFVKHS